MVKNLPANAGDIRDMGSIPGLGRYPGGWNENLICWLLLLLKVGRNHFIKQNLNNITKKSTKQKYSSSPRRFHWPSVRAV